MAIYFFDTSAIAKRYVFEVGTVWVRQLVRGAARNTVIISELTIVEFSSLLARARQRQAITTTEADRVRKAFLRHVSALDYDCISLNRQLILRASRLTGRLGLRSLDAIQLACAIYARTGIRQPFTFVAADQQLLQAAAAEGLLTDNPLAHPHP
jgi:predicted nucleic acid-binding protein